MASTEEWTVSVRKKAFTRWINAYCRRHSLIDPLLPVKDLFKDLHDGTILCLLMGKYIRQKLIKHSIKDGPLGRKQKIENVEQVVLQVNGDGIPRFSGRPDLIVDGDHEATLELVWWVIFIIQLSFSEASGVKCDEVEVKEEMLQWIQRRVEPHAVEVTDFTTSWSDGKAFCAVIHDYHASSFPYSEVEGKEPAQRLEYAFTFAEEKVSVERLLDKEDVAVPVPDEKCILLYLSLLRQNLVFLPNELDMLMAIRPVWKKVSTMEKVEFPRLHSKLYVWGPPAENKVILEQLKQLEKLKSEYDQFGKELDMLNKDMFKYQPSLENEFENLSIRLKQDQDVLTAAEHCRAPAEQFEHFMPAVDSWLNEARANVQSLLDFAKNEASCDEAQASLLIIQEAAVERKQDIDKLLHLAADFAERRKKVIDKLANCQDTCAAPAHSSSNEEGSSFTEQAAKMLQDWEWILNQCINVLQEWFTIVLTWKVDEDFSSRKQQQESFLHRCNSLFEMLIRFTETCTSASGLNLSALQKKKEDANDYWLSICTSLEAEIAKTEVELRELNQWVKGCLEELSSQSPLADNFEGVKLQKKWYQDFLQRVAQRKPEVMRYETLRLTVHTQPLELHEASEIMKEHQLLGNQWMKLEQQSPAWGELLNRCEAAWESCLATEKELCSLEEVQVQLEPPAAKLTTLAHCKEIEMFRTSRVVPFKSKVSVMANLVARLKSLGQHPPVEELCRCVTERYNQLVSSLDRLYAATQTQVDLKDRWKALLANAQALIDWANEMRKKLSEAIADKDNFGVEDHLATCENFKQSTAEKTAQFDQFQGVAASFEAEARRMGWDTEEVTAKNAEVQQSRDSLLDFIDKTQADLQAVAKRLKALLLIVTEKQAWLKDFTKRIVLWRPCFGDVSIVKSELNAAKGLLAETHTHADGIKQLVDNADFVMEHSRQGERKQVKADIMDLCQCHADHKRQLQDKVSQCQTALPLWQRFTATTTELTMLIEEKEKLLSSLAMLPSYDSDEDEGMAERIKSVQHDLVDGKDKLQLLKSLEADLTDTCDMEEDRTYIAKKCAEVRGQFDHVMKMARDALALCYICEGIRQLQCLLQQHRSLPSPSTLPGPELAKRHKGLLDDSKSIEQQTQSALKDVRKAVQAAKKGGSTITPKIQQAVDTVTADAEQLPAAAKSWREDLTNRYSAWTQFREGLEQYIQSATEVHTRVETEIVAQPIGIHLKELDAFKNELQTMLSQTKAAQKGLPPLKMSAEKFLFGEGQPVVELRDAFTLAIKQQKGTATHLEDYLNRLTSWEKYFDLFKDALAWFNPFKQVAERDIQKFEKEGSQRNSSHTKLKGHLSVMESKRVMVDQVRDFPLPIDDVQSERESVQDIVDQRDVFVKDYVQLKKRLESLIVWQSPINGYSFTYTQCLLLLLLLLFLIILCPVLVLSWLQYTCSYCSGFMYYITPSHEVPI